MPWTCWLVLGALLACGDSAEPDRAAGADRPKQAHAELTTREAQAIVRGKRIYRKGVGRDDRAIEAELAGGVVVEASVMVCENCHGQDGRGRPEGGVSPSDIRWQTLTKPYGVKRPDGREHPAYNARTLVRAVTMGIDGAGNSLSTAMPRYRLERDDANDLVAYLMTLGENIDREPGVADDSIYIGTVVPDGPFGKDAVIAVLRAYFAEINKLGGIHGRKLELRPGVVAANERGADRLRRAIEASLDEEPLALVAPVLATPGPGFTAWLDSLEIPVIGPMVSVPDIGTPPEPHIFYLDGGVLAQARALARFASERNKTTGVRALVVHIGSDADRRVARAARDTWRERGVDSAEIVISPKNTGASDIWPQLRASAAGPILYLGPMNELADVTQQLGDSRAHRDSVLLLPGSLPIGDVFALAPAMSNRVFVAYPWIPDDVTPRTLRDFQTLARTHSLSTRHRPTQLATLAVAKLLVEGLIRAGKDVSRKALVTSLEGLRDFSTELTPPVSYGPNRRVGLGGAHVLAVDMERRSLDMASSATGDNGRSVHRTRSHEHKDAAQTAP